jgi:hypothetical protein
MLNYSISNIQSAKLCNLNTGEELMTIDSPMLSQEDFSTDETPMFSLGGSGSFELDTDYMDNDLLREVFGLKENHPTSYKAQFDTPIYKQQIRKHKQKRINKKWAKRYGYRNVIGTYEGDVNFGEFNNLNSEVDFNLDNLHLIKVDGKDIS